MLSKSNIQFLKSLQQKKFREKLSCFVVEGPKLVDELLASNYNVRTIYATSSWLKTKLVPIQLNHELVEVSEDELRRISSLNSPNQVLAVADTPSSEIDFNHQAGKWLLLLDGVRDPGNLGTIIRTADWFGIRTIICSEDTVEFLNPKVVQATMGSLFRVKIHYADLNVFLENLPADFPVYGTFMDGNNIYSENFGKEGALILGSESHGISTKVERNVKFRLHIPSSHSQAESLNVSVAAAICCSEITRLGLKEIL